MYQVIIIIHVLLGLGVIGLVLMQQGKGADAGAAFGAGASGSVFGAQGAASFLSRTTAIFATLFFSTSLGLAVLNSHRSGGGDIMSETDPQQEELLVPEIDAEKIDANKPASPITATPVQPVEKPVTEPVPTENTKSTNDDADKAATANAKNQPAPNESKTESPKP